MASTSILRAGVRSPVHALLKPSSARSILKKPAALPLSPKPLSLAASFSVLINSPHPSPHVHFPSSPAMAATFTVYSPNTYDRGPITISPESPGLSGWANRQLSPSAQNAFKLLAPPIKRKNSQLLAVPAFEDPRSPKPYKEVHKASAPPQQAQRAQLLSVPPAEEDPRSPKPYKPNGGVCFQELTLHVPRRVTRGAEELGKALSSYPRSPYPSAPIEDDVDVEIDMDIDVDSSGIPGRGRWPTKSGRPHPQPPSRARSLENEAKTRHRSAFAQAQHVASPLRQSFLSPVTESVAVSVKSNAKVKPVPTPLDFDLETEFWESMTLQGEPESGYVTALELPGSKSADTSVSSPVPDIMFGSKDGQLWSPRVSTRSRAKAQDYVRGADVGSLNLLSPVHRHRKVLSKGMVASPSPHDPSAAFPSFTAVMSGMDGNLAYPPPVKVALSVGGAEARARARDVSD